MNLSGAGGAAKTTEKSRYPTPPASHHRTHSAIQTRTNAMPAATTIFSVLVICRHPLRVHGHMKPTGRPWGCSRRVVSPSASNPGEPIKRYATGKGSGRLLPTSARPVRVSSDSCDLPMNRLVSDYFTKVVLAREAMKILGAHIVGPYASVLIQEISSI